MVVLKYSEQFRTVGKKIQVLVLEFLSIRFETYALKLTPLAFL